MASNQIKSLKGSPTANFFALANQRETEGHNIIHLEIGQPDFSPLPSILESTIKAINEKKTTYTVSSGIPELRDSIAEMYLEDYNIEIKARKEIIVTSGAKQGILASFYSVLDKGDGIIIPEPYWVSYPDMAALVGANMIPIKMKADFSLNQEIILEKIAKHDVKALLVNSPNNPTGHILDPEEIKFLKDLCEDYQIYIISDEIYNDYNFIESPFSTLLLEFKDWREKVICINGFAKTYSMTGYRLGWTVASPDISQGILTFIQASTSCPTSFAQWGGVTAIKHREEAKKVIKTVFPERRKLLLNEVQKTPGMSLEKIDGAFYGFIKYDFTREDSYTVAKKILLNADVCTIPGVAFGESAEGYLRVTFARSKEEIISAFEKIRMYIQGYS